jgi:hypothetical protein
VSKKERFSESGETGSEVAGTLVSGLACSGERAVDDELDELTG